jgi:neopullulanase
LERLGDFQELVTAAHRQRMKILFDMVLNHTGPRHPWVARPPLPDWFHGTLEHHTNSSTPRKGSLYGETESQSSGHGLFEIVADPHAPPRWLRNLTEGRFFGTLPDLNTENPVVAQYLSGGQSRPGSTATASIRFRMSRASFGLAGMPACEGFIRG